MIHYVDTSAAVKLLVDEVESEALAAWLDGVDKSDHLVSSYLLHTELHCALGRQNQLSAKSVNQLLGSLDLVQLERKHLDLAAKQRWRLRSGDAIHLATASLLAADTFVTYDRELAAAASGVGITTASPS